MLLFTRHTTRPNIVLRRLKVTFFVPVIYFCRRIKGSGPWRLSSSSIIRHVSSVIYSDAEFISGSLDVLLLSFSL
jgi:hypothetical protein